jgi:hypothetical protein
LSSITPQAAAPFVDAATLESIAGRVDAAIELRADRAALDQVAGTVVLTRAELSLSGVSFDQQTPTRLLLHDGRVDVAAWDRGRGDNRVVVTGGVSLGEAHRNLTAKPRWTWVCWRVRPCGRAAGHGRRSGSAVRSASRRSMVM